MSTKAYNHFPDVRQATHPSDVTNIQAKVMQMSHGEMTALSTKGVSLIIWFFFFLKCIETCFMSSWYLLVGTNVIITQILSTKRIRFWQSLHYNILIHISKLSFSDFMLWKRCKCILSPKPRRVSKSFIYKKQYFLFLCLFPYLTLIHFTIVNLHVIKYISQASYNFATGTNCIDKLPL
jgi:hypothetical protein